MWGGEVHFKRVKLLRERLTSFFKRANDVVSFSYRDLNWILNNALKGRAGHSMVLMLVVEHLHTSQS